MWDLGGQAALRTSWPVYYKNTDAIICVVDSTDRQRLGLVKVRPKNSVLGADGPAAAGACRRRHAACYALATIAAAEGGASHVFILRAAHHLSLLHQAEVDRLLASEDLTRAAILIYANKQDLKDAMDADELTQSLGLQSVRTHPYHVQASCALTGEGLYDGLNWLVAHLTAAGSA